MGATQLVGGKPVDSYPQLVVRRVLEEQGANARVEIEGGKHGPHWLPKSVLTEPHIWVNGTLTPKATAAKTWAPCKDCGSPLGHVAHGQRYNPHVGPGTGGGQPRLDSRTGLPPKPRSKGAVMADLERMVAGQRERKTPMAKPTKPKARKRSLAATSAAGPEDVKRWRRVPAEAREEAAHEEKRAIGATYDRHREVIRGVTMVASGVGAVKLNEKYPEGLTPLKLEASTVVALSTTAAALVAKHYGYKRIASSCVDVTVGAVAGTVAADLGKGKTPLLASA